MTIAYIGLGSNLGDASDNLRRALAALPSCGCNLLRASSVYETEPQGDSEQAWFANQVAQVECPQNLPPEKFLPRLLGLENELGRVREANRRFGPRVIDLDLLLYGDVVSGPESAPELVLPHPRLQERAFVLVPLQEISPGLILPGGQSVEQVLARLPHQVVGNKIYQ